MKKSGRLITGLLGLAIAAVMILPAAASTSVDNVLVHIPENQVWTSIWKSVWHTPGIRGARV